MLLNLEKWSTLQLKKLPEFLNYACLVITYDLLNFLSR